MRLAIIESWALFTVFAGVAVGATQDLPRPRVRDLGVVVGVLPTGPLNAITDVEGVAVGNTTLIKGDGIRTGVTAILPHRGNIFKEKVPGAVVVANGFGKLAGSTQVNELGEIETPILLTSTLSVPKVADAVIDYVLGLSGNEDVVSVNPLVGETNDARLNDIRARAISRDDVFAAIRGATSGPPDCGLSPIGISILVGSKSPRKWLPGNCHVASSRKMVHTRLPAFRRAMELLSLT